MNSVFEKLDSVDVSKKAEKKGRFTYLSWAWAVRELLRIAPDSTWVVHEWGIKGNKQPYMQTQAGCFVKVSLTVDGITREQVHPVLDNRNQPIKEPNAFEINTSIQRCLAKAIALHGLGLYIFAGEDLPDNSLSSNDVSELFNLADKVGKEEAERVRKALEVGNINKSNLDKTMSALENLAISKKENNNE